MRNWSVKADDKSAAGMAKMPMPIRARMMVMIRPMGVTGEMSP